MIYWNIISNEPFIIFLRGKGLFKGKEATKMSNRPMWWLYIKNILREYPELCRKENTPVAAALCANSPPAGVKIEKSRVSKPTENAVLNGSLTDRERIRLEAVRTALMTTQQDPNNGDHRIIIIELVYFKKTHTIAGASTKIPCHENTAKRWQGDFIRLLAEILNLP